MLCHCFKKKGRRGVCKFENYTDQLLNKIPVRQYQYKTALTAYFFFYWGTWLGYRNVVFRGIFDFGSLPNHSLIVYPVGILIKKLLWFTQSIGLGVYKIQGVYVV